MPLEPGPFDTVRIPAGLIPRPESGRSPQPASAPGAVPGAKVGDAKRPAGPSAGEPFKFTAGKAADICERFPLSEQAALFLTNDLTPTRYIELLTEKNRCPDATRVLAYSLPKREAVWWACLCLREALGAQQSSKTKMALEAAETWVKRPSEENRRAGLQAAETAGFGSPAGMTALAAFWSGGSLSPPDAPVVPPVDHLTAEGVAGAVLLAAVSTHAEDVPKRQRRFLALGLAVARGN